MRLTISSSARSGSSNRSSFGNVAEDQRIVPRAASKIAAENTFTTRENSEWNGLVKRRERGRASTSAGSCGRSNGKVFSAMRGDYIMCDCPRYTPQNDYPVLPRSYKLLL